MQNPFNYIHVRNLEKYYPGYKVKEYTWCRAHFRMLNADPQFEMMHETDKWRFIAFIMLELQFKHPIPMDTDYLKRKGFDFSKRSLMSTTKILAGKKLILVQEQVSKSYIDVQQTDQGGDHDPRPTKSSNSHTKSISKQHTSYKNTNIFNVDNDNSNQIQFKEFVDDLVNVWNSLSKHYPIVPRIKEISEKRRVKLRYLYGTNFKSEYRRVIKSVPQYPFLLGRGRMQWVISFDWLIHNDTNYLKVLEGKYRQAPRRSV